METARKTIAQLVRDNYIVASVLHFFGIHFYEHPEKTLEQVCKEHALRADIVSSRLEAAGEPSAAATLALVEYPIELVVGYLRHAHHVFIKEKLPYMAHLIRNLQPDAFPKEQVAHDLQLVFPLFAEDFIHHIYEEEDSLFSYISQLAEARRGVFKPSKLYYAMEKYSMQKFTVEHEAYDDELAGIRALTDNYSLPPEAKLHSQVIFAELIAFEKSLQIHANIENRILFPKALQLEQEIKNIIQQKAKLN